MDMYIGICDDNELYLQHLKDMVIISLPDIKDVLCHTILPDHLISLLKEKTFVYDILITDIDLGIVNAIELVREIYRINPNCIVIFISSYINFATEVYEVPHVYFVLKSEAEIRLPKALEKAIKMYQERQSSLLVFKYQSITYQLALDEVVYIEALGRYLYIHTVQQVYKCIKPLKEIEKSLNEMFGRCHKSYLINFARVKNFNRSECIMSTNDSIPISTTYSKSLYSAYRKYVTHSVL
jgi:DNA-binding LytR/AlgR family response regulator